MAGCEQIPADVGILSDVGLANVVTLLAGTAFVPADVGLAGASAFVTAGRGSIMASPMLIAVPPVVVPPVVHPTVHTTAS